MSVDLGIPGYTDAEEIGRGGFGVVYRARQPGLGRFVAIKMLTPSLSASGWERLQREGLALGTLSGHPSIVSVHDIGVTADGHPYIVMAWVPGGSLGQRLDREGPVPWAEALTMGVQLAGALETAHRMGTLHRDVKPENVLIDRHGAVQLADFGIARVAGAFETTSRHITATVAHAAPEILDGRPASPSSDVYGLASTLYTAMAGRPPFVAGDDEAIVALYLRIARDDPPAPDPALVPEPVWRVLEAALAKDTARRAASAAEFAEGLRGAQWAMGLTPLGVVIHEPDPDVGARSEGATPPPPGPPAVPAVPAPSGSGDPETVTSGSGPPAAPPSRRGLRVVMAVAAVLILVAAASMFALSRRGTDGIASSVTTSVTTSLTRSAADGPAVTGDVTAGPTEPQCAIFPADDPWNTDVSDLSVHERSAEWMAGLEETVVAAADSDEDVPDRLRPGFGRDDGYPYSIVTADQAPQPLAFGPDSAAEESDPGPFPIPDGAPSWDDKTLVIDDDACHLYEVYGDEPEPWRSAFAAVDWDLGRTPDRPAGWTSADQAGLPIFPGLARYSELIEGPIDHALRFSTVDAAYAYMAPATHAAGESSRTDLPPFGARLRLRADVACTGMGAEVRAVCEALKRYGMILADRGSLFALSGTVDPRWPDADALTEQLGRLRAGDFEVVDTGAPVVSAG